LFNADPQALSQQLLSPGPGYLISAFQAEDREARLASIAEGFRLREALEVSAPAGEETTQWLLTDTYAGRWVRLLDRAVDLVANPAVRAELTAIVRALESSGIDGGRRADFWVDAARHLPGPGTSIGTLRNRRWPVIKLKLAEALVRLTTVEDERTLPFAPQVPSLFAEADLLGILERLDSDLDGLAVLIDEPGVGKSSLANAYGHWAGTSQIGRSRYDRVVWLRGDDPIVLEHDFLAAARLLDPSGRFEDSADVQSVLKRNDGWLLIIDDVRKPATLLRFLPTRATGHVICTHDVEVGDDALSLDVHREDRRHAACEVWQEHFGASLFDYSRERLIKPPPPEAVRDLVPGDDEAVGALLAQSGDSRLALRLAAAWASLVNDADPLASWSALITEARAALEQSSHQALADRPGVVACTALLRWADGPGRASFDGGKAVSEDESSYELLRRLEPFASHPIPIDAFRGRTTDARVGRLVELGLGLRHRYLGTDFLTLAGDVRPALRSIQRRSDERSATTLAIAGLTALRLSEPRRQHPLSGAVPTILPHIVSLAERLIEEVDGGSPLPTTALVLRSRAAIAYWAAGSGRRASDQLARFEAILADNGLRSRVAGDLLAGREQGWPKALSGDAQSLLDALDLASPSERLTGVLPLLRQAGDRSGALRVFWSLDALFEEAVAASDQPQLAAAHRALQVEGALALHENGDIGRSTALLTDILARPDADPIRSRVETMLARDAQDRGDLVRGAAWLASAWQRVAHGDPSSLKECTPWADLGRIYAGMARGARFTGRPHAAAVSALVAAACWERSSPGPSAAHAFAAANAGMSLAQEAVPGALHILEAAVDEVTSCAGSRHHETALICLSYAFVRSTQRGSVRLAGEAESSFRTVITHWPRRHPFTLRARLQTASCNAAAGCVTEALRHLLVFLDNTGLERPVSDPLPGREEQLLARSTGWSELGALLVEAVPHVLVEPDSDLDLVVAGESRSLDLLQSAIDAFAISDDLLARATTTRQSHAEPGTAAAFPVTGDDVRGLRAANALGRLEAHIRLGDASPVDAMSTFRDCQAVTDDDRGLASRILRKAAGNWTELAALIPEEELTSYSVTDLRAIAKLVRATTPSVRAAPPDYVDPAWFTAEFWRGLLTTGPGSRRGALLAVERVEYTLAWQSVISAGDPSMLSNQESKYGLQDHIEANIALLRNQSGDGPDHRQAIWYSALAQLPDDKGTNHRRARNLREVARNRARLAAQDLDAVRDRIALEATGADRHKPHIGRVGGQR
jgi:hypothetical protein